MFLSLRPNFPTSPCSYSKRKHISDRGRSYCLPPCPLPPPPLFPPLLASATADSAPPLLKWLSCSRSLLVTLLPLRRHLSGVRSSCRVRGRCLGWSMVGVVGVVRSPARAGKGGRRRGRGMRTGWVRLLRRGEGGEGCDVGRMKVHWERGGGGGGCGCGDSGELAVRV